MFEKQIPNELLQTLNKLLHKRFDHTNLGFGLEEADVRKLCDEAVEKEYYTRAICTHPYYVTFIRDYLEGIGKEKALLISPVIDFPYGMSPTLVKKKAAEKALEGKSREIDLVMNVGAFKDKKYKYVEKEIREIVLAVSWNCVKTKVIIEAPLLSCQEISDACKLAEQAGADFVKDSTGKVKYSNNPWYNLVMKRFAIWTMHDSISNKLGVKGAGGLKTLYDALYIIKAGATIIGTSNILSIINEAENYKRTTILNPYDTSFEPLII